MSDEDFEWELKAIFNVADIHPSDPIAKSLPYLYDEDVLLPPAFGATMVQSEFVTEDNAEEFAKPIRETKYWAGVQYDPALVDDFSTAKIPDDAPREVDFRYPEWLKPHLELKSVRQHERTRTKGKRDRSDMNDSDDRRPKRNRSGHGESARRDRSEHGESPRGDHRPPLSRSLSAATSQHDRRRGPSEAGSAEGRGLSRDLPLSREAHDQAVRPSPPRRSDYREEMPVWPRGSVLSDTETDDARQKRRMPSVSSRDSSRHVRDAEFGRAARRDESEDAGDRYSVRSRSSSLTPLEAELLGEDSGEEERRKRDRKVAPDATKLKAMAKRQPKPNKNRMNEAYR